MTHSICTSDADEMLSYFQRLGRTLFAPNIEPRTRLEQLFEDETAEFDLDYAFLSHIDLENKTERFEVVHGSHEILKPGTTVPLSKTYCRKTIADSEGTIAVSDALDEGWEDDPAYEAFEFGSYLGTTVSVADELYGTLCFADTAARDEPLIDKDKALVEMYGQWVGYILSFRDEAPIQETPIDIIEGRGVSSEAIDSMMGALTDRTRRVILMALLGGTTETSIATLERELNHEKGRLRLYHNHLPKLANSGYIKWDKDANTVSKGPKFSEVEPLVQRLKEYETAFSG
ncbi:GAF domain-containing protein [Haloarchaeobius sp. HRN-SO-5]|uniref:GAF domain-containing protein n=1 Tax=Haloarchaeobius sp. HRN-SO-5 TaxID=3446118 RepID=UPI003EBDB638